MKLNPKPRYLYLRELARGLAAFFVICASPAVAANLCADTDSFDAPSSFTARSRPYVRGSGGGAYYFKAEDGKVYTADSGFRAVLIDSQDRRYIEVPDASRPNKICHVYLAAVGTEYLSRNGADQASASLNPENSAVTSPGSNQSPPTTAPNPKPKFKIHPNYIEGIEATPENAKFEGSDHNLYSNSSYHIENGVDHHGEQYVVKATGDNQVEKIYLTPYTGPRTPPPPSAPSRNDDADAGAPITIGKRMNSAELEGLPKRPIIQKEKNDSDQKPTSPVDATDAPLKIEGDVDQASLEKLKKELTDKKPAATPTEPLPDWSFRGAEYVPGDQYEYKVKDRDGNVYSKASGHASARDQGGEYFGVKDANGNRIKVYESLTDTRKLSSPTYTSPPSSSSPGQNQPGACNLREPSMTFVDGGLYCPSSTQCGRARNAYEELARHFRGPNLYNLPHSGNELFGAYITFVDKCGNSSTYDPSSPGEALQRLKQEINDYHKEKKLKLDAEQARLHQAALDRENAARIERERKAQAARESERDTPISCEDPQISDCITKMQYGINALGDSQDANKMIAVKPQDECGPCQDELPYLHDMLEGPDHEKYESQYEIVHLYRKNPKDGEDTGTGAALRSAINKWNPPDQRRIALRYLGGPFGDVKWSNNGDRWKFDGFRKETKDVQKACDMFLNPNYKDKNGNRVTKYFGRMVLLKNDNVRSCVAIVNDQAYQGSTTTAQQNEKAKKIFEGLLTKADKKVETKPTATQEEKPNANGSGSPHDDASSDTHSALTDNKANADDSTTKPPKRNLATPAPVSTAPASTTGGGFFSNIANQVVQGAERINKARREEADLCKADNNSKEGQAVRACVQATAPTLKGFNETTGEIGGSETKRWRFLRFSKNCPTCDGQIPIENLLKSGEIDPKRAENDFNYSFQGQTSRDKLYKHFQKDINCQQKSAPMSIPDCKRVFQRYFGDLFVTAKNLSQEEWKAVCTAQERSKSSDPCQESVYMLKLDKDKNADIRKKILEDVQASEAKYAKVHDACEPFYQESISPLAKHMIILNDKGQCVAVISDQEVPAKPGEDPKSALDRNLAAFKYHTQPLRPNAVESSRGTHDSSAK